MQRNKSGIRFIFMGMFLIPVFVAGIGCKEHEIHRPTITISRDGLPSYEWRNPNKEIGETIADAESNSLIYLEGSSEILNTAVDREDSGKYVVTIKSKMEFRFDLNWAARKTKVVYDGEIVSLPIDRASPGNHQIEIRYE